MPDQLFNIIPMIVPVIVLSVFAYYYFGSRKKAEIEEGKKPLLQEQCGGRFDSFNLTIPFVRHAMYDDFIVIAYGKKKIILRYEELKQALFKKHIISNGITYLHNRQQLPVSVIVWTVSYDKALNILRQKDVNIKT